MPLVKYTMILAKYISQFLFIHMQNTMILAKIEMQIINYTENCHKDRYIHIGPSIMAQKLIRALLDCLR
jgi:hypothetical protein